MNPPNKNPDSKRPIYWVQSINRAIDVLECFTYNNRELSLFDLAEKTGLDKSTVRRIVSNLELRGLLTHDPDTKRYVLGMRLFEWGGIVFSSFSLRKAAAHAMSYVQGETGGTTLLASKSEDQIIYIDKKAGDKMIAIQSDIGWRRPLSFGLFGKVFMAYLDKKEARRVLKKYPVNQLTPYTITDEKAFFFELEKIRKAGYGIEIHEVIEGLMGVAAPVRDYSREVVGSMCLSLPASKAKDKKFIKSAINLVLGACEEISSNLGYLKI